MKDIFWEKSYEDLSISTFGKPSKEVVELVGKLKTNANILDVGCGDGRHSVYLATLGFSVDAIDLSEKGIKKIKELADPSLDLNAAVCDICSFESEKNYDLVIMHGLLQFLEVEKRNKVIEKMKVLTEANGYHVIAVFTDELPLPEDLKEHLVGVFHDGEIRDFYKTWQEEMYQSYVFQDEHEGGIKHDHAINKAIYKKISL